MAYVDAAKKDGRPSYFVFRGQTKVNSVTIVPVAWATRTLATATGIVEGRLKIRSSISRGMPDTVGGRPSKCQVTISLDNTDNSLRALLIGSTSTDPKNEYREGSILNLSGKIYAGVVDTDGTTYEQAITPTIVVAGSPAYDGHLITLPMSSDDDKVLGRSRFAISLDNLKHSGRGTVGVGPGLGAETAGVYVEGANGGSTGVATQDDADTDLGRWSEGLDVTARFIYSATTIPLVRTQMEILYSDQRKAAQFFCFVSRLEPQVEGFLSWTFSRGNSYDGARVGLLQGHRINKIQRWVKDSDGADVLIWVVWVKQYFEGNAAATDKQYQDEPLWLSGLPPYLGVASVSGSPPPPKNVFGTPSHVINRIVADHSRGGSVDATTFDVARKAIPFSNLCGGLYTGDTPMADIFYHIANAFGLSLVVGTDDLLRVYVTGSFTKEDALAVQAGGLDELTRSDVLGGWKEIVPREHDQRGAPVNRITVDWTQEQEDFWGKERLVSRWKSNTPIPLATLTEARLSGAWMNPDPSSAVFILSRYASAFAFVARRIQFRTRLWVAAREIGTLMLLTHYRGLESIAGGYARRLVRLENVEIDSARRSCIATFEDLGPVANLKVGLLDDYAQWVKRTPTPAANNLTLSGGSVNVVCSAPFFNNVTDQGTTLCVRGSAFAGNRRNRKIVTVADSTHCTVDIPFSNGEVLAAAGAGLDAAWLVEFNHAKPPAGGRETKYIHLGKESNGKFLDGTDAFVFEGI
jgi:hypothetical protein